VSARFVRAVPEEIAHHCSLSICRISAGGA
jgi:hypothetical protein